VVTNPEARVLALGAGPLTLDEYDTVVAGFARVDVPAGTRARMTAYRESLLRQLDGGVRTA